MATTTGTYNPQQGFSYNGGAYGANVAPVNLPNPSAALAAQIPGLSGLNNQLSGVIGSELSGELSPSTMNLLKDASASAGVAGGYSGSGFQANNALANLGLTSEQVQQKGVSDYNSVIPTISGTQTLSPQLEYEANLQNAVSAAAPNPAAAAQKEQQLLQNYLSELEGGGSSGWPKGNVPPGDGDWHQMPGSTTWLPGP